jgi:hypothetical protein
MLTPMTDHPGRPRYAWADFADVGEAAAFVAALSRSLYSPHGEPLATAEIWSRVLQDGGCEVYLDPVALEASKAAFGAGLFRTADSGLPGDAVRLLGAGMAGPWEILDVERRLTNSGA